MLIDKGEVGEDAYGSAGSWFKKASDLGSLAGCHNLGVAYEYGKNGMQKDYVQARAFYLRAAEAGYMQSQYNLGSMYSNNYVSPPDDMEGLKWLLLAQMTAAKDPKLPLYEWVLKDPPGHKRRLEGRLSPAQQQEALRRAAEWKPKP